MVESRTKIIFVITSSGVGGAEKMLYHTIAGLDQARFSVRLCSLKEKGVYARALEAQGIAVYCPGMSTGGGIKGWFDSLRAVFLLFRYFMKERPTIVHAFLFRANIIARIAAFLASVPLVICSVRVMGGEKKYYHLIERVTAFMVDHYTAVSAQVQEYLCTRARVSGQKVSAIPNGVFLTTDRGCRRSGSMMLPGIGPDDRVIMTAGRLHRQKGFDCLIQAMVQVHRSFPSVKLLILGEGDEENSLKNLVRSLELNEKVIFAGLCPDPANLFPQADLFVLPSRWEGMPNVILEAMAAGIPVVATDVGGVPELVVHGVTGVMVPPGDVHRLANAIEGLLGDELKAQAMGAAGRERAGRHFSVTAMVAKTEKLYHELMTGAGPT